MAPATSARRKDRSRAFSGRAPPPSLPPARSRVSSTFARKTSARGRDGGRMQHRIAALTLALVCAACFAPSADSVPLLPEEGVRIDLPEEALAVAAIGASRALHATVLDAEGRPLRNARILWSSTDPSVASVDGGGVVTAVGRGRADVVAAYGGIAAKAHVRVLPPPPGLARIGISPKEPTLT